MRLYCMIPNYVFFEKIAKNQNKFGSIECDDLAGTYHDNFTYDLPSVLSYLDKEEWMEDSICAFATPAECKNYLDDDSVMIAFEHNDNDYLKIDADEFYNYVKTKIDMDKALFQKVRGASDEEFINAAVKFNQYEEKQLSEICKPKSFYDSLIVVPHINISSIKAYYVSNKNVDINLIKKSQHLNLIIERKSAEMGE